MEDQLILGVEQGMSWWAIGGITLVTLAILAAVVAVALSYVFRKVVDPNEVHVVQSGSRTQIYGNVKGDNEVELETSGNTYYDWPDWWMVVGVQSRILPLSVFDQDLSNYEAYDVGKVPFMVDVKAFYRISNPLVAAKRVSTMEELYTQLKDILRGAARTILAKQEVEDIMMERSKYGKMFTDEVSEQLKEWGVSVVKSIELMDIKDSANSATISNIMAKKESFIEMESRTEVANNGLKAEVAEIDAGKMKDIRDQEAMEAVGLRTAQKDQAVGIADEQAQQKIKVEAKTTAEREMNVQQVEMVRAAEIEKDVQVVQASQQKETDVIKAEGEKQQTVLLADGQKQQVELKSVGDLVSAENNAKGIIAVGKSTAEAEELLNMAEVTPQLALAEEIGENEGYQSYLIGIRDLERGETVGVEQAKALKEADLKIIVNDGNVSSGVDNVMDIFSPKGGTALAGMVEGFVQSETGKGLVKKFVDEDAA